MIRIMGGLKGPAFQTLRHFAEKTLFFRSLRAGRRDAAASRFTFFKGATL